MESKGKLIGMVSIWVVLGLVMTVIGIVNLTKMFQALPTFIAAIVGAFVVLGLFRTVFDKAFLIGTLKHTRKDGTVDEEFALSINLPVYGLFILVAVLLLFASIMKVPPTWFVAFVFIGYGLAMATISFEFYRTVVKVTAKQK